MRWSCFPSQLPIARRKKTAGQQDSTTATADPIVVVEQHNVPPRGRSSLRVTQRTRSISPYPAALLYLSLCPAIILRNRSSLAMKFPPLPLHQGPSTHEAGSPAAGTCVVVRCFRIPLDPALLEGREVPTLVIYARTPPSLLVPREVTGFRVANGLFRHGRTPTTSSPKPAACTVPPS